MWCHVANCSRIIGITNAIHVPTWVDPEILKAAAGDGDLWNTHQKNKQRLIDFIKERNDVVLDPEVLLIGFSRRAAQYKRSGFIFSQPEVIFPLLENHKVQIVFSGKAHPLDDGGKKTVESLVQMAHRYPQAVVFLENYDMTIGKMLTSGSDIWLNNPRRPKEASGTSGMKAAMNGVMNLSILDGWWPEVCKHGINGWQFGDGFESHSEYEQDAHDLRALYRVLLEEVLPTYYNDREKWLRMMRESINSTRESFAVKRMLEEYFQKMYIAKVD